MSRLPRTYDAPVQLTNKQANIYVWGFQPDARFRDAVCGRRFGKTFLGKAEMRRAARLAAEWGVSVEDEIWYAAPTQKQARRVFWRRLKQAIPPEWRESKPNETDMLITLKSGHLIRCVGLENYDDLRGSGLFFVLVDEWADCTDVFVATTTPHIAVDWNTPPKARKPQRQVLLRGEIAAGSVPPGAEVFALYEPPSPPGLSDDPDMRAAGTAKVLDCNEDGTEVLIMHRTGKDGDQFPQLPFALTPGPPPNTKPLRNSIETTAADVAAGLPSLPPDAALDILLRSAPRTVSTGPLPRTGDAARDIVAALRDLDSSYLAVHGPPGTGKTYTASKVIADLVSRDHWRIGVVAQSHAVVENVLSSVVKAGVDGRAVGKKRAPEGAPRLWINPAHVVTVTAIVDRAHQPPRLFAELKLVGVNLARYWLATGTDEELQAAWDAFAEKLAPSSAE